MRFRKRLFEIIESAKESDRVSNIYDIFMMITIVASIIPLAFKEELPVYLVIDKVAVVIFIIDYLLRILTADYKLNKGALSFILYPITPMALIDLLCILPSLNIISGSFRLLKVYSERLEYFAFSKRFDIRKVFTSSKMYLRIQKSL